MWVRTNYISLYENVDEAIKAFENSPYPRCVKFEFRKWDYSTIVKGVLVYKILRTIERNFRTFRNKGYHLEISRKHFWKESSFEISRSGNTFKISLGTALDLDWSSKDFPNTMELGGACVARWMESHISSYMNCAERDLPKDSFEILKRKFIYFSSVKKYHPDVLIDTGRVFEFGWESINNNIIS